MLCMRKEQQRMTAVGDMSVSVLAAGASVSSQLFGSGLIGLREGLETAIVVTILIAFLVKSDRRDALKWVWFGVAAAIVMTIAVFLVIQFGENTISGLAAEAIAGVASLVAVAIVTTMVLWMKKASATISGELRGDMARALETGGLAVLTLAFLAVGREGVETALFMVGYAEADTLWPLVGLVVVAAGILSYGIGALQTVGWLPGLANKAFDITSWFNWSAWYGEAIQGIFNVTPTPTVLQLALWLAYLVIVLALFLRPIRKSAHDSSPSESPDTSPSSSSPTPEPEPSSAPERSTT